MNLGWILTKDIAVPLAISIIASGSLVLWGRRRRGADSSPGGPDVPRTGGLAIAIAFVVAFLILERGNLDRQLAGLLVGGFIVFLIGALADTFRVPGVVQMMAQILGAVVAVTAGIYFEMFNPILSIPLALLWIIGITNAFRTLDTMDGLAAGTAAIACLNIFVYALVDLKVERHFFVIYNVTTPAVLMLGSLIGFLFFNFSPARLRLGRSGAYFVGFFMAALTIVGANYDVSSLAVAVLFPLLILTVPVFDTTLVAVVRGMRGRPGDARERRHTLIRLGLSERRAVLLLYAISLLAGSLVIANAALPKYTLPLLAALLWVVLFYLGTFLAQHMRSLSDTRKQVRDLPRRAIESLLVTRVPSVQLLIDFLLAGISLSTAYLIQFDGNIPDWDLSLLLFSFPIVAVSKIACLYFLGAYRHMWRYITVRDLTTVVWAASLGSLITFGLLLFLKRFIGFSRAVYVMDWLLFIVLTVGARQGIRFLREWLFRFRTEGSEVFVFGAGDAGNTLVNLLQTDPRSEYQPVAFFDDDETKHHKTIQRIPIVGAADRIAEFAARQSVKRLVIAVPSATDDDLAHVFAACDRAGLEVLRFSPARLTVECEAAPETP